MKALSLLSKVFTEQGNYKSYVAWHTLGKLQCCNLIWKLWRIMQIQTIFRIKFS